MRIINTLLHALERRLVTPVSAHCDTEDGPVVTDGRRALETGNASHALKWVSPAAEDELRQAFDKALQLRQAGAERAELEATAFLEALVGAHRAGEGAGFDGIKPAGTPQPAQVTAADLALEQGTLEPLRGLVSDERWPELARRFEPALALRGFDADDLVAAREWVAAYVRFFKFAEGHEEHGHCGHHH